MSSVRYQAGRDAHARGWRRAATGVPTRDCPPRLPRLSPRDGEALPRYFTDSNHHTSLSPRPSLHRLFAPPHPTRSALDVPGVREVIEHRETLESVRRREAPPVSPPPVVGVSPQRFRVARDVQHHVEARHEFESIGVETRARGIHQHHVERVDVEVVRRRGDVDGSWGVPLPRGRIPPPPSLSPSPSPSPSPSRRSLGFRPRLFFVSDGAFAAPPPRSGSAARARCGRRFSPSYRERRRTTARSAPPPRRSRTVPRAPRCGCRCRSTVPTEKEAYPPSPGSFPGYGIRAPRRPWCANSRTTNPTSTPPRTRWGY